MMTRLGPLLLALVMTSAACAARTATKLPDTPMAGDWLLAAATAPGSEIRVDVANGRKEIGEVVHIDANEVVLLVNGATHTHARAQIQRIFLRTPRVNNALRGFLIGAAGGGLQGLLSTKSNRALFAGLFGAAWGAIGACIGAVQGLGTEETLVYLRH